MILMIKVYESKRSKKSSLLVKISNHVAGGAFWPIFLIANVAALIASRAMTTATFSCIKQSTALGCFPRLKIIHTSRKFMGQIYIPVMNWFLLALSLVMVCSISSIYEIGNAYGNAWFLVLLEFIYFFATSFGSFLLFIPITAGCMLSGAYGE